MQQTSLNYIEIRNVGKTLNMYIFVLHFCGNLWEKMENHGEITHI